MSDLRRLASLQRFTDNELLYLAKPSNHNSYVHYRRARIFISLPIMLVSYFGVQMLQSPNMAISAPLIGALIYLLCTCALIFMPCRCGKLPLLTAKGRANLRERVSPNYTKASLQNAAVQLVVLEAMVYLASLVHCLWVVILIEQFALMGLFLFGVWFFIIGSLDLPRPFRSRLCLSDAELSKFSELKTSSAEVCCPELLLEFFMKTGNFDDAEKLSRTLIERAERP